MVQRCICASVSTALSARCWRAAIDHQPALWQPHQRGGGQARVLSVGPRVRGEEQVRLFDAVDWRLEAGGNERRQPHAVYSRCSQRDRPMCIHTGDSSLSLHFVCLESSEKSHLWLHRLLTIYHFFPVFVFSFFLQLVFILWFHVVD